MFFNIIFFVSVFNFIDCLNIKTFIPRSLWGRRILLNGPVKNNNYISNFDGYGHITSVVFKKNEAIISEVKIPTETEITFPLSDFLERDYLGLIYKLPYLIKNPDNIQSGTRNTAVCQFNNKYYAVEESCRPIELKYDKNDNLYISKKSDEINKMSPHLPNKNTIFSYTFLKKNPLKLNNSIEIPWQPRIYPFLIHDCKSTDDLNYYIFPLMSTSLGNFFKYFIGIQDIPLNSKSNKMGWLIYDKSENKCHQIFMNEYADVFHIANIEHLNNNIYKIYASFVYNFVDWLTLKGDINIKLKEITIDFNNFKIIEINNTNLSMDFVHKINNNLIGSSLASKPGIINYDCHKKNFVNINLVGDIVREIIPYDKYLLYFSHSSKDSYLCIADLKTGKLINKIQVPNRIAGFHTTLF